MSRAKTIAAAFGAGAVGEYFLDPENGTRRRHVARDRSLAFFRRPAKKIAAEAQRKASYAEGVAHGVAHKVTHPGDERDPGRFNDAGLKAKIESEVFRPAEAPKGAVDVNVEEGIVYLRGELDSQDEIDALGAEVEAVEGVREVRSLLHVPQQPAPMKS